MNAGCLAFIIQTSDVRFMVKNFARLAHSPRSTYRANRKYLYLPSRETPDEMFEATIKEMYLIREMDFMPDLVIAKLITESVIASESSSTADLRAGKSITESGNFNA